MHLLLNQMLTSVVLDGVPMGSFADLALAQNPVSKDLSAMRPLSDHAGVPDAQDSADELRYPTANKYQRGFKINFGACK
jgi:hypothetical protein